MALYTIRSGVNNHPEDTVLQQISDLVRAGGVLYPSADFVSSVATGGGLNVDISQGRAYVKGGSSNAYPVRNTAKITLEIDANGAANPRYTSAVLYIDTAAEPDDDGQGVGVAVLTDVNGTPAASPVPPTEGQIIEAIGNKPYLVLGNYLVNPGDTGISAPQISTVAKRVFMRTPSPTHLIPFAESVTPNLNNSNQQKIVLTDDLEIEAPTNMEVSDWLFLEVHQNSPGGHEIDWFSGITWMSADITLNLAATKVTTYAFKKTGSSTYLGFMTGKAYS